MIYKPSKAEFFKVEKQPDGIGGTTQMDVSRGTMNGYLDMLTGDDEQAMQKGHIEQSTHVIVVRPIDNGNLLPFMPLKGDLVKFQGKDFVVTYVDDPVGVGHHLEVFLDNSVAGVV